MAATKSCKVSGMYNFASGVNFCREQFGGKFLGGSWPKTTKIATIRTRENFVCQGMLPYLKVRKTGIVIV